MGMKRDHIGHILIFSLNYNKLEKTGGRDL